MTTADVISGAWLNLDETILKLGRSQRTIQKWVKAKHLKCRHQRRPGRSPEPLYWEKDVARIQREGVPRKPHERRETKGEAKGETLPAVRPRPMAADQTLAIVLELAKKLPTAPRLPAPWLSLDEASEVSGLAPGFLRRKLRDGEIDSVRGGPRGELRIRRASLEKFEG